jgi:two-component system cell cycle sensor histidine kinase/response regulator CckA
MVPASDGEAQEVVREVLAAGERGRGLTRQLLTLSRKQAHTPQELRLQDVVADMQDMLRRLIPAPIVFETRPSESCDPIWADRSMVEQVVLNLCVNARDAMPSGGTVTVGVAQIDQAGITDSSDGAKPGCVRLWVSDSGEGMSEQVQAGIFDPFYDQALAQRDRTGPECYPEHRGYP